jgi:hypothetical protein
LRGTRLYRRLFCWFRRSKQVAKGTNNNWVAVPPKFGFGFSALGNRLIALFNSLFQYIFLGWDRNTLMISQYNRLTLFLQVNFRRIDCGGYKLNEGGVQKAPSTDEKKNRKKLFSFSNTPTMGYSVTVLFTTIKCSNQLTSK